MNLKLQFHTRDKILWCVFYPLIALSFIFIANENPFFELVQIPSFKTDLIFAFLTTFGIGIYLHWLIKKLNDSIDQIRIIKRLKYQFLFGLLLPLVLAIGLEVLYLKVVGIPFQESSILNLELPLAFLFLLLINLYYLSQFLYFQTLKEKQQWSTPIDTPKVLNQIIVQKGHSEEKIELSECAYLTIENKVVWLYTFGNKCSRLSGSLEDWESKLDARFFKINRQYIVSHSAIQSIEMTPTRKIKVNFQIPNEEEVYVSKVNAARFKVWWKKDCPLG